MLQGINAAVKHGGGGCTTPTYTLTKNTCAGTNVCATGGSAAAGDIIQFREFISNSTDILTGASDPTNGSYSCLKPTFVSTEQFQDCFVVNTGSGTITVTGSESSAPSGHNSYTWLIHPSCGTMSQDTSAANGGSCDSGSNICTFPSVTVASNNSFYSAATWGSQWTSDINMTHQTSDGVVGFGELFDVNTISSGSFTGQYNTGFNINTRPVIRVFHAN
jgi:hypothetical protein